MRLVAWLAAGIYIAVGVLGLMVVPAESPWNLVIAFGAVAAITGILLLVCLSKSEYDPSEPRLLSDFRAQDVIDRNDDGRWAA